MSVNLAVHMKLVWQGQTNSWRVWAISSCCSFQLFHLLRALVLSHNSQEAPVSFLNTCLAELVLICGDQTVPEAEHRLGKEVTTK